MKQTKKKVLKYLEFWALALLSSSSNLTCKGHTTAGGGLVELKS